MRVLGRYLAFLLVLGGCSPLGLRAQPGIELNAEQSAVNADDIRALEASCFAKGGVLEFGHRDPYTQLTTFRCSPVHATPSARAS